MFAAVARIAALSTLVLASAAQADATFDCAMTQRMGNKGWVPDQVIVGWDESADSAIVYDPVIANFIGNPIEAEVETDNAKRTTFRWKLKVKAGMQYANMTFRLTVMKADLSASMQVRPLGYADDFTADGTCKRAKG